MERARELAGQRGVDRQIEFVSALLTDFLPTAEEGTFDLGCACYFPAPVSTAETTLLRVDHDWAGKRPGRMSPAGRVH